MSTRFLKAFNKQLKINDKYVNESNPSEIHLFNDREEVYTYVTTLTAEDEDALIPQYRKLVEKYKISLEYTYSDGWVYLIEKCPHDLSPIAHQLPARPLYNSNDPIKFYKEKYSEESSAAAQNPYDSFFTKEYYDYFKLTYNRLFLTYRGCHSLNYILMEAFLLTMGKWFSRAYVDFGYTYFSTYHYRIKEKSYEPGQPADLYSYGEELITTPEAKAYVQLTQEGQVPYLAYGEFYNFLPLKHLYLLYADFFAFSRTEATHG